ncbi:hypothetical protein SprV_0602136100 [Sparganum proliferum]
MRSGRLLRHLELRKNVDQEKTVFWVDSQEEVVVGAAGDSTGTRHSPSGSGVCPEADIEVAKDSQFVYLRHSRREGVQVLVELVPYIAGAGH